MSLKIGSLWLDVVSAGADCLFHVMVAVASGRETFAACGALERLHVEVDSQVALKVAQLPHLFMANFALEHVGVYTACFLADIVLTDAVAHDVRGGLDPLVIEDACGLFLLCILVISFFLFRLRGFCHNLIL